MSSEDIKKAQTLQQQVVLLDEQLRIYKQRLIEIDTALRVINEAKEKGESNVFQFLGANVMVRRDINDVLRELSDEKEFLKERVKRLEEHARDLKRQLIEISRRLETAKQAQGG